MPSPKNRTWRRPSRKSLYTINTFHRTKCKSSSLNWVITNFMTKWAFLNKVFILFKLISKIMKSGDWKGLMLRKGPWVNSCRNRLVMILNLKVYNQRCSQFRMNSKRSQTNISTVNTSAMLQLVPSIIAKTGVHFNLEVGKGKQLLLFLLPDIMKNMKEMSK